MSYNQNPEPIKQRAREHSAVTYAQNPEPQRKRAREYSSKSYRNYTKNFKNEKGRDGEKVNKQNGMPM